MEKEDSDLKGVSGLNAAVAVITGRPLPRIASLPLTEKFVDREAELMKDTYYKDLPYEEIK
jgi:hypothetical protein